MDKECQYSHDNNKPSMFLDRETLYDNNFYEWKMIPKYLICKTFGSMSKFHANLNFKKDLLKQFKLFIVVSAMIGRPMFSTLLKFLLAF